MLSMLHLLCGDVAVLLFAGHRTAHSSCNTHLPAAAAAAAVAAAVARWQQQQRKWRWQAVSGPGHQMGTCSQCENHYGAHRGAEVYQGTMLRRVS